MKIAKLLAIVFVTVLMFSNISFGQNAIPSGTARWEALGSSPFFLDPSIDINNNPAWASQYRNYLFGDIGRNTVDEFQLSGQFAGVNFGVSKDMTLGLVLNKREDVFGQFNTADSVYIFSEVQEPVVPLKVLFSYASKNFAFGLAPYYTAWSLDAKVTPTGGTLTEIKRSSSVLGGTIGILSIMDKGWIEGYVDVKMHSFKEDNITSAGTTTFNSAGGMLLSVGTRGFFLVDKKSSFNIVPFLGFSMYSWNPEVVPAPAGVVLPKYSRMNFGGGIGINCRVLDDGIMAGGLTVAYRSYKIEQLNNTATDVETFTDFVLPKFNVGLEWNFTEWLQGRLGYSRAVISSKDKQEFTAGVFEFSQSMATDADETISLGLGMQFGRFSFDGTIGENFFKQAPSVISGRQNATLYGILSASYNFNR